MRTGILWPLGIILLALLCGPACEDDPHDLDPVVPNATSSAGSSASAAGASAAGSDSNAGTGGSSGQAGAGGAAGE